MNRQSPIADSQANRRWPIASLVDRKSQIANPMNRPWKIWLAFALCAAVLLGVMSWVSFTALRLDRLQLEAARQAELEERARLALWRMDSALAAELLPPSEVDLAEEMTQQILALRSLQANLPIIRAEDEMTRDLLDASRG